MTVKKSVPSALLCTIAVLLPFSATTVAAASGGTGTIDITVTDPVRQPIPNWLICPTSKPHGTTKVGHCATTNDKGEAKLSHVKPGAIYVSRFWNGRPVIPNLKKIIARAHHITRARWENAGS